MESNCNSRESLKPIFILMILKEFTDREHPCTQKFIQQQLAEVYHVSVARQALGKILNLMLEEDLYIFGDRGTGYFYDRRGYRPRPYQE